MKLSLAVLLLFSSSAWAFDSGRASFAIRVNELSIPYQVFAVFALPGETLELAVAEPGPGRFLLETPTETRGGRSWTVKAPANPGVHRFVIRSSSDHIQLNVLVMHPSGSVESGKLDGYDIGEYPAIPLRGNPIYEAPRGFVELSAETAAIRLSPHFTLSQFPCKQSEGYPKYLVVRELLILKLEMLLERLNAEGIAADSFSIMSGYRTPYYNRAIGNVPYSRHVYGGAADIFVDVDPEDGRMDDLDGNGKVDYRDAQFLYRLADNLFGEEPHVWLAGGKGVYRRNEAHGPFLHIDARGERARWGLIPTSAPANAATNRVREAAPGDRRYRRRSKAPGATRR